jgi:hypothetical protein
MRWKDLTTYSPAALAAVNAALIAKARRSGPREVKAQARHYLVKPERLALLKRGYDASCFTPAQLIEFAKEILRQEIAIGRVEIVPIRKINACAAIVTGRYRRRFGERQ